MKFSHIVAKSINNVIGIKNGIPWDIPGDRKYFKKTTLNHPVIMGRLTFDSLKKPLVNRRNIVISKTMQPREGVEVVSSPQAALQLCRETCPDSEEVFIIGGSQIYAQTFDSIDRVYLTLIYQQFEGDAFYDCLYKDKFTVVSIERQHDPMEHAYLVLDRV